MARLTDTISGPIVTFRTPGKQDIRSLKVHFAPVQEGSGDPSPENVREIEGWTRTEVYHSGADISNSTILPIDWTTETGTIYGGYVDLVKGEVAEEWHKIVADGVNVKCNNSYMTDDIIAAGIVYLNPTGKQSDYSNPNVFMDTIPTYTQNYETNHTIALPYATATNAGSQYIIFKIANRADYPEVTDANTCKEFVNNWLQEHPTTIVYELNTPIVHTLTPTALRTFIGTNNIWSNANGNVDVEYDFAESREMFEARKRVAGYSPWKLMWHNSFDKYQIRESQTGSVVTVMDDGKWLKAVSNGQNKNSTDIYMNDRFLYNDIKDKLCRITYTIECDQSVVFDGTNTFGNITLGLLNTKTTPSTTAASTERVSKVDIVKQDTFIGHHSVEFVPSELFADLKQADYFGWNLGFRSSIDGITIRITQLDFEVKK